MDLGGPKRVAYQAALRVGVVDLDAPAAVIANPSYARTRARRRRCCSTDAGMGRRHARAGGAGIRSKAAVVAVGKRQKQTKRRASVDFSLPRVAAEDVVVAEGQRPDGVFGDAQHLRIQIRQAMPRRRQR